MARERYSNEDALKVLREINAHLQEGLNVLSSWRKAGISDKTYYYWRKKLGGIRLSEIHVLRKEAAAWQVDPEGTIDGLC